MLKLIKSFSIINTSLFMISTYMSALMFIIIANSIETKIAMIILAIIFEVTKLSDLKKTTIKSKAKFFYLSSYILKALLSVTASLGLILTLFSSKDRLFDNIVEQQRSITSNINEEVKYWNNEIQQLDKTIKLLNENIAKLPPGYGKAGTSFVNQISVLQELKEKYRMNYSKLLNNHSNDQLNIVEDNPSNPSAMFLELSNLTQIPYSKIRLFVFLLIMILVETSLALGCISAPLTEKDNNSKKEFIIDTLDNIKLSKQAYNSSSQLVKLQANQELNNKRLLTQKELSNLMAISHTKVNNIVRRYVKPIMKLKRITDYKTFHNYLNSLT